ncbi:hypothetical protein I4U23_018007 [Adineta vaga]|nr:hypothetical protein I4U23_018007 [Adineta vaga]
MLIRKENLSWWKSISIEPIVFLYMFAIHLAIPTDEALLYRQVCYQFFNISTCNSKTISKHFESIIQKYTSIYVMFFNIIYAIPSIFISIIYVTWSEKYSHKIPMIFVNLSCILATLMNLILSIIESHLTFKIFFFSNIIFNLFGSSSIMFSILYNYLTHLTRKEDRRESMAIIESCFMFGSTIGLILSGILLDWIGFQWNFILIICLHLINIVYIQFYVDEVCIIQRNVFTWKNFYENLSIEKEIKDSFRILFKRRKFHQRRYLLLALGGESSIVYLYLKRNPLSFSPTLYGLFRGLKSFTLTFGLLVLLPILRYLFNINDITCIILGILSKFISDFLYTQIHFKSHLFIIPFFGMLSSYVIVGIRSYLSKICNHNEEGKIFSIIASFESIDALIGSFLFNFLYSYTIDIYPNLIFFLACFFHFLTLVIFIYIRLNERYLNRRKLMKKHHIYHSFRNVRYKSKSNRSILSFQSLNMAFTPYQLFLAALMLITGSINTLSTKWADRQTSHFCDGSGENVTFEHPFLQGVGMFLGEFLCLLAFKFIWYSTAQYRIERMTYKGDASSRIVRYWPIKIQKDIRLVDGEQTFNPLIFWVASICDMTSTCLSYIALNYTSASSFQMLRGSSWYLLLYLGSVVFLRKKLTWKHWLGIFAVVAGLAVIGVSDILFSNHPEGSHTNTEKIIGDVLILIAMLFTSCQVVYEERFIGKYNIPPLQAVGWEGIFGFSTLGLLLIPFYFIIVPTSNSGPDHRLEDVPSALCQMRGNWIIILATMGNVFSIAFFNFAGISVTKELSSTTRMVLDSGRTLIIWVVSLALQWQAFYPLQILGFAFLVIGMGIYNGVWEHLIRRFLTRPPISNERSQLLPNHDDVSIYQSTSTTIPSNILAEAT